MTSEAVYVILLRHLPTRRDLGMGRALLDGFLCPANPFDSSARRRPRQWFLFFILVGATLVGCFLYFNRLI